MQNQNRKLYDFSSVGETKSEVRNSFPDSNIDLPIGILTPVALGNSNDGIFKMSKKLEVQVKDNLRNLIMTNWGERMMLYDFGANLGELLFELGSESADTQAIIQIKRAIEKYMPFIQPLTFETFSPNNTANNGLAVIGIRLIFKVPTIGNDEYMEEIIMAVGG